MTYLPGTVYPVRDGYIYSLFDDSGKEIHSAKVFERAHLAKAAMRAKVEELNNV